MKMTFKSCSMLLAMAAALSLTACRQESLEGGKTPVEEGNCVFVSAAVALPSSVGTRSATDGGPEGGEGDTNSDAEEPDFEIGYTYENDVRTMILVFATSDKDEYIAHTVVSGITESPVPEQRFDFIVNGEIKYEDLEKAYDGLLAASQTVHIYAFCNYTNRLLELFEEYRLNTNKTGLEWLEWNGTVEEQPSAANKTPEIANTIWAKRSFLMTNARVSDFAFPKTLEDWDPFADKSNPYKLNEDGDQVKDLTPIKVERAAARFDFRDASEGKDQVYHLYAKTEKPEGEEEYQTVNPFDVKLTRMSLVNMSKDFYYLRRVSSDGMLTGAKIGGVETVSTGATPYVVDTDADLKAEEKGIFPGFVAAGVERDPSDKGKAGYHFNFPLYNEDESYAMDQWYVDNIKDVLNKEEDTWAGSVGNRYKIWRYVTENTIPGINQQKTVQSVGIIFKGAIMAGKDVNFTYTDGHRFVSEKVANALSKAKENDGLSLEKNKEDFPTLYSFAGSLYAGIEELVEAAVFDGTGGPLRIAMDNVLSHWKLNGNVFTYQEEAVDGNDKLSVIRARWILSGVFDADDEDNPYANDPKYTINFGDDDDDFNVAAPNSNFTVYKASDEKDGWGVGYYCYYFYWNRHNDNGNNGRMGTMEFATVRNNVYKLSVKEIGRLGHPRFPKYDPDPVEPEDPDEDPTNYIQVQVEVLPWVVRENEIKF